MNTIQWWKAHPQYRIAMHLIVLYPGSELYKIAVKNGVIKDPVQFIKDGCPYLNVSKMTDQEYKDIALTISMQHQSRTELLENTSVEYLGFGKAALTAKCPRCGRTNNWRGLDVFRSLENLVCEDCNKAVNAIVCDYIGDTAEKNYQKLAGHKIGIWAMTNAVAEFLETVPSAREENTYLIDHSEMKQGAKFEGKIVYAPSVIEEEGIDIVFVTLTTSVATEIIAELKERYTGVKHIFFLGDLIDEAFERKVRSE
jgi:phage FluMu protein Com